MGVNMIKTKFSQYFQLILITFFASLIFQQSIFASTVRDTFQKSLNFKDGGFVSLSNSNGNVEIVSWDKNEVEIIAHKKVKAEDQETAEKLMERLEIDVREKDDEIIIETYYPRGSSGKGFFGWLFGKGGASFSVEYEIKVPKRTDLNIHTTNGGVRVEEITGRLRLESTNGKINARDISGLTGCHRTNGLIRVEFDEVSEGEEMIFKTTNGSIKLYLPDDYGADDVELKTTNGHIDSDFPMSGSSSRKSKKRFRGSISEGNRELNCLTTNGSIYLLLND
jgi:DUF4097 and DUF4098 domain-containing protein YvlB